MDNNRTTNEDVSYIIQRYIGDASEVHQRYYEAKQKKGRLQCAAFLFCVGKVTSCSLLL